MADTPKQRVRPRLTLLRVESANLNFGCLECTVEGTDTPATLVLLDNRHQRVVGGLPRVGDVVGCEHVCHSVYSPRIRLAAEELAVHTMLRTRGLPFDVTEEIFPIRRPLYSITV